jgi:ferrous iron transport protein A
MPQEKLLSQLKKGDSGVVVRVNSGDVSLRLMEMGLVPGASIQIDAISPFGDAIAIRVANYTLSLRRDDANILILCPD